MFFLIHVLFSLFNQINADLTDIEERANTKDFGSSTTLQLNTLFTAPSDGYLIAYCSYQSSNYVYATFNGIANSINIAGTGYNGHASSIFIKKGMTAKITEAGGDGSIKFHPLA